MATDAPAAATESAVGAASANWRSVDACLHVMFEQNARAAPGAPAVICGDTRLTYAELSEDSNRLAAFMISQGVGPQSIVALCLDRSPRTVAAMLAVLKAGAAYLPLDPEYPAARAREMLVRAHATMLMTQSAYQAHVRGVAPAGMPVHSVESLNLGGSKHTECPQIPVSPDDLAYVMYTSGSTGLPKGVGVSHRAVIRLAAQPNYVAVGGGSRILGAASLSFDASTFELWAALLNGGCVVLLPDRVPAGDRIRDLVARHGIDTAWLTASLFNQMIDADPVTLAGLRYLLVGGEALSAAHVSRAYQTLPDLTLINGYGPTECTTFACTYEIPRAFKAQISPSVPIGRPINNTRVYVLDERLRPAAPGMIGELYVSGDGLARGYLSQPALTAERFVADPYGPSGQRMYRTGDFVKALPDGNLDFVGRKDEQVKIRGFRIEPAEIERTLSAFPGMRQCAVLTCGEAERRQLVSYVVGVAPADIERLRTFMAERLPAYMVPARIVPLTSLPLTLNGKLDHDALMRLGAITVRSQRYAAPRNAIESTLASIWADALKVDRVGIYDNFLELGGHSILALAVIERLRQVGLFVGFHDFYTKPTIDALAAVVECEIAV